MSVQSALRLIVVVACAVGTLGTQIKIVNQCDFSVTAYVRASGTGTDSYALSASGGSKNLDVGSSWVGGLIWASKDGNQEPHDATQLEMSTNQWQGLDFYDISLVNAYNLAAEIQPIDVVGGTCGAPTCNIGDLASFCQAPNVNSGDYCTNTDGPGLVSTSGTAAFQNACPEAYSWSKDDGKVATCQTGANYNFVFCP